MVSIRAFLAIVGVFVGCCVSNVFLELLVNLDSGAGTLITFAQFLFVAFEGFIFTSKFGTTKRIIGLQDYMILVILFFLTSVCNNIAFSLNIPMPLHMIFRGGSLISNIIMGTIILRRRYRSTQYISCIMISVGIFLCTYYSKQGHMQEDNKTLLNDTGKLRWLFGILLLTVTLLASSYMGIRQELLYRRKGKHAREALYYTHILPLPAFMLLHKDIVEHFEFAISTETFQLPVLPLIGVNLNIPIMLVYLFVNVLSQYLCISSVYMLTSECTSLTVTLVLTLRKLISLLFSILYFQNPFTVFHWLGTCLVFVGTLLFSDVVTNSYKWFKLYGKRD